jgi:phosphate transport system substrate-binding protein
VNRSVFAIAAGLVLTAVAGCGGAPSTRQEVITLPGSGESQDVLRDLARNYFAQHSERRLIVPDSIGSDGGIRVVGTGESPVGRVARRPTAEEKAEFGNFKYLEFARVPVVFVVSKQAGVRDLAERQICDIFARRLGNWKEVGGHDAPIEVRARPEDGSNMRSIRKHMACFAEVPKPPHGRFNLRNADLVASMRAFPGAIGFMPLGEALLHGYQVVTIDGVEPTAPEYKLLIGLGFVYKKSLPGSYQAFVDYLNTPGAREIMSKTGHVPVEG